MQPAHEAFDNRKSRVLVVDDDTNMRRALVALLSSRGFDVEAFGSAEEFLRRSDDDGSRCLILDLRLGDLDGLELQQRMAQLGDPTPIVFVTADGDIPSTVRAMRAGAVDFLSKPLDPEQLLAAVYRALDTDAKRRARAAELDAIRRRFRRLTPRQCDVLRLLLAGKSNKQIAAALGTVEQTIKMHRGALMRRLEVGSLAELARLAERASSQPWSRRWAPPQLSNESTPSAQP